MARRTLPGRWWLVGWLAMVAVVGVVLWLTMSRGVSPSQVVDEPGTDSSLGQAPLDSPAVNRTRPAEGSATSTSALPLMPADVLGNRECFMRPGVGHARDMAVVVVLGEDESRFLVIDRWGVVFGDRLPFRSTPEPSFAQRSDGSMLVAFSGVWGRGRGSGDGVIYQDGQVIYESREVSHLGVADEGSSYFTVERMAGDVSRLVIRNLDLGIESHHDLGVLYDPSVVGRAGYVVQYSGIESGEVVVRELPSSHVSVRKAVVWSSPKVVVFPTDGGIPRQLPTGALGLTPRLDLSSRWGYFTRLDESDWSLSVVKQGYRYDDGDVTVEDIWSRDLIVGAVSEDGAWLVAERGRDLHFLDAATGETVFERRGVLTVDHSMRVRDGRLVLRQAVGEPADLARCRDAGRTVIDTRGDKGDGALPGIRHIVDQDEQDACFADLRDRGLLRTVHDVYDLRSLAAGDPPDHYRVDYSEDPHCGSGDDPFGTLGMRDGQLVYVPRGSGREQR